VIAIMAQRLVRVVCSKCKEPDKPPSSEISDSGLAPEIVKTATFMRGRGCSYCNHTGYRGRLGIYEMLRMNADLRQMTFKREPTQTLRQKARALGMRNLLEDGVQKAVRGITTLEEVLSICHREETGAN